MRWMESLYIYQNLENYGMTFNNHQQCSVCVENKKTWEKALVLFYRTGVSI